VWVSEDWDRQDKGRRTFFRPHPNTTSKKTTTTSTDATAPACAHTKQPLVFFLGSSVPSFISVSPPTSCSFSSHRRREKEVCLYNKTRRCEERGAVGGGADDVKEKKEEECAKECVFLPGFATCRGDAAVVVVVRRGCRLTSGRRCWSRGRQRWPSSSWPSTPPLQTPSFVLFVFAFWAFPPPLFLLPFIPSPLFLARSRSLPFSVALEIYIWWVNCNQGREFRPLHSANFSEDVKKNPETKMRLHWFQWILRPSNNDLIHKLSSEEHLLIRNYPYILDLVFFFPST